MQNNKLLAALPLAALFAAIIGMQPATAAEPQEGMVVVRDPKTGKLRAPTPAEARALQAQRPPTPQLAPTQPQLVTRPDGSRQVRLGERGQVYSVVTRDGSGKLHEHCVHGEAAADKALRQEGQAPANHKEPRHETH